MLHLLATILFRLVALTQDRTGTYRLWGKIGDEGVDRNFKAQMGEEVELASFKTFVTAELYTHFPFINIPVSQPDSACTRLQWKLTDTDSSCHRRTNAQSRGGCRRTGTMWLELGGLKIKDARARSLEKLGSERFLSFATCQCGQRKVDDILLVIP